MSAMQTDKVDANEIFEAIGDLYYAQFHRLRPGKSEPAASGRSSMDEDNVTQFDAWRRSAGLYRAAEKIVLLERENAALREQLAERDAELAKLARTVGLLGVERSERDAAMLGLVAAKNETEQIIEKQEAEIVALKGHAEAMHGLLIRTMPKLTPADNAEFLVEIQNATCNFRADFPGEK